VRPGAAQRQCRRRRGPGKLIGGLGQGHVVGVAEYIF
jgi:hypothetical protein